MIPCMSSASSFLRLAKTPYDTTACPLRLFSLPHQKAHSIVTCLVRSSSPPLQRSPRLQNVLSASSLRFSKKHRGIVECPPRLSRKLHSIFGCLVRLSSTPPNLKKAGNIIIVFGLFRLCRAIGYLAACTKSPLKQSMFCPPVLEIRHCCALWCCGLFPRFTKKPTERTPMWCFCPALRSTSCQCGVKTWIHSKDVLFPRFNKGNV
jgi:hypothetical protein